MTSPIITSGIHTTPRINDTSADHQYIFGVSELTADRTITLPLLTGNDTFVFQTHTQTLTNKTLTLPIISQISNTGTLTLPTSTDTLVGRNTTDTLTNKTLTSPVLTSPQINDTSLDHQYIFVPAELTANRNVNLPLLANNDTLLFEAHSATLTNKTINNVSNIVTCDNLRTATTVVSINGSVAPSSGQALIASNSTTAAWADTGDLDGPASSTDEALVRFDGTTGKLSQNSTVTLSDTGVMTGPVINAPDGTAGAPAYSFSASGQQDVGIYRSATDSIGFSTGGLARMVIDASGNLVGNGTNGGVIRIRDGGGTESAPSYSFVTDTDTGMYNNAANVLGLSANSADVLLLSGVTSGVNEVTVTNAATGAGPSIVSTGSDANVPLTLNSKGTGVFNIGTTGGAINIIAAGAFTQGTTGGAALMGTSAAGLTATFTSFTGPVIIDGGGGVVITSTTAAPPAAIANVTQIIESMTISNQYFMAYNTASQTLAATPTAINWDVQQRADSIYSHTLGTSDITINLAGDYLIRVDLSIDSTAGSRTSSRSSIRKNGTSITGTDTYGYHRNTSQGNNTVSIVWVETGLVATDTISVESDEDSGGNGLITTANACRIYIQLI